MSIEIIDKLKQKNNGTFKLIDLEDVDYDGTGTSTKDKIEELVDNQITLEEDDTSMNGIDATTHDTLTTTDKTIIGGINEVNSQCKEIEKKAITNEERTKLSSLENYDDTEIKTNINNKADKTTTDNIQQQVNNLVLGAVGDGNNAEVVQARGKFKLLNERLDSIEGKIVPLDLPVRMTLGGNKYPYVDDSNKRIVFPANKRDTVIYYGSNMITNVFPNEQESYIDLSGITTLNTSLGIILMNIATKEFSLVRYDFNRATYKNTHIIIGTVRAVDNILTVSLPVPFLKNEYLYGQKPTQEPTQEQTQKTVIMPGENDNIKSIAHRGYSLEAPENTLPSYKLAKQKGYSYGECDVEWTADNVPVLLHDTTIDRTSNGKGDIHSLTLEQLKQYDFGSWKDAKYTGTTIPTLDEFILYCKKISMHPYIELKPSSAITDEKAIILINVLKKYSMLNKCTWISFSIDALKAIKKQDPNARLGYLVMSLDDESFTAVKSLKTDTNEVFVDILHTAVDTSITNINKAIELGIEVEAWTVDDGKVLDALFEKNISGITTDRISVLEHYLS